MSARPSGSDRGGDSNARNLRRMVHKEQQERAVHAPRTEAFEAGGC